MASPQWKNFQPSAQESAMPNCERSPSYNQTSNDDCLSDSNSSSPNGSAPRETGIVEKLLHSYGFIQCCERQARLFFHYSQYSGTLEHLKLGDAVEFEMTYDRRTGKPIASAVCRIAPDVGEVLSEERVSGFITTEIKDNTEGRVAYESRGECFFLPYCDDDIDGNIELHPHDRVTFRMATDKNTGNLRARNIRLERPIPERFQGTICALKETFGFIERADVVKEIFFHSTECKSFKNLKAGDDVEFSITTRCNKEVAINVTTLPAGTVIFDDIDTDVLVGEVTRSLERDRSRSNDTLNGKIQCQLNNEVVEYPFGERDPKCEYTLQVGDWVQFQVATDRRDNLERATCIEPVPDAMLFSKEKRERGFVSTVKESYGFITYGSRDSRLYFRLTELLDPEEAVRPQDEVEFTVAQDPSSPGRCHAIRIKVVAPAESDEEEEMAGVVEREGLVCFERNGLKERVPYSVEDCEGRVRAGDKVDFSLRCQDDTWYACYVKPAGKVRNGFRYTHRGFVAALKETFGFIETEEHEREVFFHYSVFDGSVLSLEVGQEVEYGLTHKGSKLSAECVRKLPAGVIEPEEEQPGILNGVIVNPVRCFNPDQEFYSGKVRLASDAEEENSMEYEFGITSLLDKHEFLQKGDVVQFQIGITKKGKERAINIKTIRNRIQATVDTIKGNFGFLCYEAEEGKKLFFHMTEVKGDSNLQPGDRVEFVIVNHQRTGKNYACSVVKVGESQPMQRPERLNRLRTISTEGGGPKLLAIRQPKGPDGSTGFRFCRQSIGEGLLETAMQAVALS